MEPTQAIGLLTRLRAFIARFADKAAHKELRDENAELRRRLSLAEDFDFENEVYWKPLKDGERDGPFCPSCKGGEGKSRACGSETGAARRPGSSGPSSQSRCAGGGAQAIYLRVGPGDFSVAPYTTDGDLAIDPRRLEDEPALVQTLEW
jgi:hypothetical protein